MLSGLGRRSSAMHHRVFVLCECVLCSILISHFSSTLESCTISYFQFVHVCFVRCTACTKKVLNPAALIVISPKIHGIHETSAQHKTVNQKHKFRCWLPGCCCHRRRVVLLSLSLSQIHTDGRTADDYQNLHSQYWGLFPWFTLSRFL